MSTGKNQANFQRHPMKKEWEFIGTPTCILDLTEAMSLWISAIKTLTQIFWVDLKLSHKQQANIWALKFRVCMLEQKQ